MTNRKINLFFFFLTVSLIGNVCVDYSFVWYVLSSNDRNTMTLSWIVLAQTVGTVVLAPFLAVYLDKLNRRTIGFLLDGVYSIILLAILYMNYKSILSTNAMILASAATACIASLHKNTIIISYTSYLGKISNDSKAMVKKMNTILNMTSLFGIAVSGFLFKFLSFGFSLFVGIVTFLPLIYFYLTIGEPKQIKEDSVSSYFGNLTSGFRTFYSIPLLFYFGMGVAVLNVAAGIFPMFLAKMFTAKYPTGFDLASVLIAFSIFVGTLFLNISTKIVNNSSTRNIIVFSVIPATVLLILSYVTSNPFILAAAFTASCCGSAIRNSASGLIRVELVSEKYVGRVNSFYSILLSLGQAVGALFVLPAVGTDNLKAYTYLLLSFGAAAILSFLTLPKDKFGLILEKNSK